MAPRRRPARPAHAELAAPLVLRAVACRCGRPVFFRNSTCLACNAALGYDPDRARLLPLAPTDAPDVWVPAIEQPGAPRYRRCANLETASACNWLLPEAAAGIEANANAAGDSAETQCRCCRLTRMLPDLSVDENLLWWGRIAVAQRRLLSTLIALHLPAQSRSADPQHGLAFDLLRQLPGQAEVVTGHAGGVITLDLAEADDAQREARRHSLGEPYRTLLGHLRHESGHYYWDRLVAKTSWLEPCRSLFGDERADYTAALQRHYGSGPPADWGTRHVSAYASSHPWEDWAETWAHYLHLVDTLDTACGFGLDGERVELRYERWRLADLDLDLDRDLDLGLDLTEQDALAQEFIDLVNGWMELTGVLNELSRSMGQADFYPFVLARPALRKLHLVHRIVRAQPMPQQGGTAQRIAAPDAGAGHPAAAAA